MNIEDEVKLLQKRLAEIDLHSHGSSAGMSFLVLKLDNLKIKMYQETQHANPHVHIDYGKNTHVASYCIKSGERLVGELSRKYDKTISSWVLSNQPKLNNLWQQAQLGRDTSKIIAEIRENT